MRATVLILAFVTSACTRYVAAPVQPPQQNKGIDQALSITADAACLAFSTGVKGRPDTAWCDLGSVLVYCSAGVGAGASCVAVADLRPKQPAATETKDEPKPAEAAPKAPPPKPSKAAASARPEPPKSGPSLPAKAPAAKP